MAELIQAKSIDEAIENLEKLRRYAPYRYALYNYLLKVSDESYQLRERMPNKLKDTQELYKIAKP